MDEQVTFDAEERVARWTDDTLMFEQLIVEDNHRRLITGCTAESWVKFCDLCNGFIAVRRHQFVKTFSVSNVRVELL